MELKIGVQELSRALSRSQGIVEKKSTMPILSHVLLEAQKSGELTVSATDLDVAVQGQHQCESVAKEGKVAVPARHLFDIVKSLPEAGASLRKSQNNYLEVRSGGAEFRPTAAARTRVSWRSDMATAHVDHAPDLHRVQVAILAKAPMPISEALKLKFEVFCDEANMDAPASANRFARHLLTSKAFQQALFGDDAASRVAVTDRCAFEFHAQAYAPSRDYDGRFGHFDFRKHFYGRIGDFDSKEEFECACWLDIQAQQGRIQFWARNLVRREGSSFFLQKADARFYPDFLVSCRAAQTSPVRSWPSNARARIVSIEKLLDDRAWSPEDYETKPVVCVW